MNFLSPFKYLSFVFFLIIGFCPVHLLGQTSKIDSLLLVYESLNVDSQKVNLLNAVIDEYYYGNPQKALEYALLQEELIEETAISIRIENYNTLGVLEYDLGNFASALNYFNKETTLIETYGSDEVAVYEEYSNIASCYLGLGDTETALGYLFKALEPAEEEGNLPLQRHVFFELSNIYSTMGEYEKALSNIKKSLLIAQEMKDIDMICYSTLNVSRIYLEMDSLDIALPILEEGLKMAIDNNFQNLETQTYNNLSLYYLKKKDFDSAILYGQKSLAGLQIRNNPLDVAVGELNLASAFYNKRDYPNATIHLENINEIAEDKTLISAKKLRRTIAIEQKDYKKGSQLGEEIIALIDSSGMNAYQGKLAQMETLYDVKNKEKDLKIKDLEIKEQEVTIANKNLFQRVSLLVLVLISILLLSLYYAYRQKMKNNEQLKKLNQLVQLQANSLKESNTNLKDFSNTLSHDILSQVELIISMTGLNAQKKVSEAQQNAWSEVKEIAQKLKAFALGLITLSKIDGESKSLVEVDLNQTVKGIQANFQQEIKEHDIQIETAALPTIFAHEVQMTQLFQNLIGNAIKYRKADIPAKIEIAVSQEENSYIFSVKDNGIGIPADKLSSVFESFTRIAKEKSGNGLGLTICKKIVEYYGGKIWLASDLGEGTTVSFTYPK